MPPVNVDRIREGRTPFGNHPVLSGEFGAKLAGEEYARAGGDLERLGTRYDLGEVLLNMQEAERGHETELQDLAVKIVAEAYGLDVEYLETFVGEMTHTSMGDLGAVGEGRVPEPSGELSGKLRELIAKRRTHNAIIHGTGLNHMNRALVLGRDEVERIRGGLFDQYTAFVNMAALSHFHVNLDALPSMHVSRAGRVRVEWDEDDVKIHAEADSFPVMVQELSKGVAEINMAHGLPQEGELTAEEQSQFTFHTDNEFHEPYYFMMGPALASRIQKTLVDNDMITQYGDQPDLGIDLAYARTRLAMMPAEELHEFIVGLLVS